MDFADRRGEESKSVEVILLRGVRNRKSLAFELITIGIVKEYYDNLHEDMTRLL